MNDMFIVTQAISHGKEQSRDWIQTNTSSTVVSSCIYLMKHQRTSRSNDIFFTHENVQLQLMYTDGVLQPQSYG